MSDLGFAFEIGDVVRLAVSANQTASDSWIDKGRHIELRGIVTERLLQECPSGIQRHYIIRFVRFDGNFGEITRHNEIELVASEPFPKAAQEKERPTEN